MIAVNPSASFEASIIFDSGLLGDVGFEIIDGQGATSLARSTTGIIDTSRARVLRVATKAA